MYLRYPYCQKVLPTVYDDSLSYYEVLCKLTNEMNNIIDEFNSTVQKIIESQFVLNEKGEWDAETEYAIHDLVLYEGSSYFATAPNTNVTPGTSSDWQLLAERGKTGPQGERGPQGEQGAKGDTGATGAQGTSIKNVNISEVE